MSKYAYAGVTLAFFVVALVLDWACGWMAYVHQAAARGEVPLVAEYAWAMGRETLANWQGEFLQVAWQLAGLAWFLRLGAGAAHQRGERVERKLDALLHYLALDREREEIDSEGARPHEKAPVVATGAVPTR